MSWLRLSTDLKSSHRGLLLELFPVDVDPLPPHSHWSARGWTRAMEDRWLDQGSEPVAWLDIVTGNAVLVEAIGAEERQGILQARLWVQAAGRLIDLIPGDPRRYADHTPFKESTPCRTTLMRTVLDEVLAIEGLALPRRATGIAIVETVA